MSVKRYGIFLAYPPTVDLRHEGLGRYLASFLKGAAECRDVNFVLLCPSWSYESLEKLFRAEDVPSKAYQLLHPSGRPFVLGWYEKYLKYKARPSAPGLWQRCLGWAYERKNAWISRIEQRIVKAYSVSTLLPVVAEICLVAIVGLLLGPLLVVLGLVYALGLGVARVARSQNNHVRRIASRLVSLLSTPKDDALVVRLYKYMQDAEV